MDSKQPAKRKSRITGITLTEETKPIHKRWTYMLGNAHKRGYTVCDRWMDFRNFLEDFPKIRNYEYYLKNPSKYRLTNKLSDDITIYDLDHVSFETMSTIRYMSSDKLGYKNVYRQSNGTYVAFITNENKNLNLGVFSTPEAAAKVVDDYLISIGDTSYLNDVDPNLDPSEYYAGPKLSHSRIDTTKIYYNKRGYPFRLTGKTIHIQNDVKCRYHYLFEVEFINTGYKKYSTYNAIHSREIKDIMAPSLYDIGIVGMVKVPKEYKKVYNLWATIMLSILKRYRDYSYEKLIADEIVDKKWMCFPEFMEDVKNVHGYDLWERGVRCMLINIYEYTRKIDATSYEFIPVKSKKKKGGK